MRHAYYFFNTWKRFALHEVKCQGKFRIEENTQGVIYLNTHVVIKA